MLAVTLRTLEADGLVSRKVYPEVPPRVEYRLTPRGDSLMPYLDGLVGWAMANMPQILAERKFNNENQDYGENCSNAFQKPATGDSGF